MSDQPIPISNAAVAATTTRRWYTAAYRAANGNVIAVGAENTIRKYAEGELADWQLDEPDGKYFLAYRDLPQWSEVAK